LLFLVLLPRAQSLALGVLGECRFLALLSNASLTGE
jgi:hypothetical protein